MSWNSLQIGLSGTVAARRAMEVISENVANVNTDGYSRRRVEQAVAVRLSPMGSEPSREIEAGVRVARVTRMRDALLDNAYRTQSASVAGSQVRADVAARAEEVLGPLNSGVQDAMGDFWAAWEKLASNPGDVATRYEVLSAGDRLATQLRNSAQQIHSIERLMTDRRNQVVDQINEYSRQLAQLNSQIGDAVFRGAAPNDLLDERDVLLDKLSRLLHLTTSENSAGVTSVYVGAFPLVDGVSSLEISTPAGGSPVWSLNGSPVELSGELGAMQEALDLTLPGVESSLDEIAAVLRQVVNDQHRLGVTLDGAAGGDFFVGSTAADLRLSSSLGPRDLAAGFTAASADNGNALVMADLGTRAVAGAGATDALLLDLASRLGRNAVSTEQMARVATSTLSTADDQRQSGMGVNLDEEMADLVRYQRAYEASARVMQIADEMLERLINLNGR